MKLGYVDLLFRPFILILGLGPTPSRVDIGGLGLLQSLLFEFVDIKKEFGKNTHFEVELV